MIKRITVTVFILLAFLFIDSVNAEGTENIDILTPSDSTEINGIVDIRWVTNGTQLNSSRVFISSGQCDESRIYFGDIRVFDGQFEDGINTFIYSWDTSAPLLNALSTEDGQYCLTANAVYGQDGTRTVEESINITITNSTNRSPNILNDVTTVFRTPDDNFTLDFDASDLDGDRLNYSLLRAPGFLGIDTDNGLISTIGALEPGIHTVVVRVVDPSGSYDDHPFVLNVIEDAQSISDDLSLTFLTSSNIFGREIALRWNWQNEPFGISIQYSHDAISWTDIEDIDADSSSYNWNTESLLAGNYYLRFIVRDNLATLYAVMSPEIYTDSIDIQVDNDQTPSLFNLNPGEGSTASGSLSRITGEYTLPAGRTLQSFELTVNESIVVTNCNTDEGSFACTLTNPLQPGSNKYLAKLVDSSGSESVEEITFTVEGESVEPTSEPTQQSGGSNLILLGIVLLILIVIFFFALTRLRSIVTNRLLKGKDKKKDTPAKPDPYMPEDSGFESVPKDDDFDPFAISTGEVSTKPSKDVKIEEDSFEQIGESSDEDKSEEVSPNRNVTSGEDTETSLPSSYGGATDEELPDWLKDIDDASDPVGIEPEELEGNKPLEGTQPFGMNPKSDK